MTINEAFEGKSQSTVDKVIAILERMEAIQRAINLIRYDEALFAELPDVVEKLAAAKEVCIAEIKAL